MRNLANHLIIFYDGVCDERVLYVDVHVRVRGGCDANARDAGIFAFAREQ